VASTRDPRRAAFFAGRPAFDGIYVGGYGAIFFVRVQFPLASTAPTEAKETTVKGDSVWDETKAELYGTGKPTAAPQAYDPNKVEKLKNTILSAFKYASNMRELKPDESVIVVAMRYGPGRETGPTSLMVRAKKSDIDSFAAGKLPEDEFRQRAIIMTY